jgi:hypothetical protein
LLRALAAENPTYKTNASLTTVGGSLALGYVFGGVQGFAFDLGVGASYMKVLDANNVPFSLPTIVPRPRVAIGYSWK